MTRIEPSPMPGLDGDPLARIDRAERTGAGGPGAPFRAALRKADKRAHTADDPPPSAQPQPQTQAQHPPPSEPGSIADMIASTTDGAAEVRGDDLADATLAGVGLADPADTAPAPRPAAKVSESPMKAWVAAAVSRAIGSFAGGGSPAGANAANAANGANAVDAAATPTALADASVDAALAALSPLEQAVHDLIGRAAGRDDKDARDPVPEAAAPDASSVSLHVLSAAHAPEAAPPGRAPASAPVHAAPAAQLPEPPSNPSHVHLILDEGLERTVVTVAVRGSEVRVALRASDDATGAALARNAASLDHAMRARGLSLGELTAEREPHDQRPPRDPEPRERPAPHAEPFELEEKP